MDYGFVTCSCLSLCVLFIRLTSFRSTVVVMIHMTSHGLVITKYFQLIADFICDDCQYVCEIVGPVSILSD